MTNLANIKHGVSLYSYQEEYYTGKLSLEQCIAAVAKSGATGIELLPEQMLKGFPKVTDEFVDQWFGWMDQYIVEPIAYDAFLDNKLFPNRVLRLEENVDMMVRDLKLANKLGFKVLRTLVSTPLEVVKASLPFAEEYGVKIALEVHAPFTFGTPWFEERMEYIIKSGTKWFGIMPDLGIFVKRMAPVMEQRYIRDGATPEIIKFVSDNYANGLDKQETYEAVTRMKNANKKDVEYAELAKHFVYTDPTILKDYIPYIMHVHGKFYEVTDNYQEPSIPYKDIINVLIEAGYQGYIDSEYEGNRHIQDYMEVDSVEQVRRHQVLLSNLLNK
ncbi:sugar phosphate isomerase/epimerase family protein [Neobacillus cucumis]|uniref:sugar phosphate isomerase/epimerase family protein n=1 Tax=Neobacillus cucumis TaxID=1740721 RepID=UPI0028535A20|nr:TIM barrel protein [Neobacillus cucumis]MDR4946734.1 TIM barrel protein [Neobacillus cucumis]